MIGAVFAIDQTAGSLPHADRPAQGKLTEPEAEREQRVAWADDSGETGRWHAKAELNG